MTGAVHSVSQILQVPTQSGKPFEKRELVLNCSSYNSQTGEPIENYIKFEFTGDKMALLDSLQVGQRVVVSFSLQGRSYTNKSTGHTDYFTSIRGYKIEQPQTRVTTQPGEYKPQQAPPQPVYTQPVYPQQAPQQPYQTYYPNQEPPVYPPQSELPF